MASQPANPALPISDSFNQWLLGSRWVKWLAPCLLLLNIIGIVIAKNAAPSETVVLIAFRMILLFAQAIIILTFAISFSDLKYPKDKERSPRATLALEQFYDAWLRLLFYWFFEYLGLTALAPFKSPAWLHELANTVVNLLNNWPTIALIVCYKILSETTIEEENGTYQKKPLPWRVLTMVLGCLTFVELAFLAERHQINYLNQNWLLLIFPWVSGIVAGTITALVVGRLDSKFINLPWWAMALLYLYAVIQCIWQPMQLKEPTFDPAIVLNLALVFKSLLFLVVLWLFKSGILLFYCQNLGEIVKTILPQRTKYLERVQANDRSTAKSTVQLFCSYSHKDESLRAELEYHLKHLQDQGIIDLWYDRKTEAGDEWKHKIDKNLISADIILLLVSANFMASGYCMHMEMNRALDQHNNGVARVIPIILRDVDWSNAPFSKLQALPRDGRAVTKWRPRDAAWRNVSEEIAKIAHRIRTE